MPEYNNDYNNLLLLYYQANGATSGQINDAEREFLIAWGAEPLHNQDMWYEFLQAQGFTGSLSDMLKDFWCNGGLIEYGPNLTTDCTNFEAAVGFAYTVNTITLDGTASDSKSVKYDGVTLDIGSMYRVTWSYSGTGSVRVRAGDSTGDYYGAGTRTEVQTAATTEIRAQTRTDNATGVISKMTINEVLT